MPLPSPVLDSRGYQELLNEALARIPVHTPEWTNFNASDPGVTLAALFAFLTENSLHLLNRAPDNLQRRFLERLELPLQAGAAAQAVVTFANARGPVEAVTLDADLELRGGEVAFRTTNGLDVLPLEALAYVKRELREPPDKLVAYYKTLYTSFLPDPSGANTAGKVRLYETVVMPPPTGNGIDLADSVDRVLWLALLAPPKRSVDQVRRAIGGKVLNLGIVPVVDVQQGKVLAAGGSAADAAVSSADAQLTIAMPRMPENTGVVGSERRPVYATLLQTQVPTVPAVFEVQLPPAEELFLWNNLDPLEPGSGEFPPVPGEAALEGRLLTWLRIGWPEGASARVLWCGINAVHAEQRRRSLGEVLATGTGRPDQQVALAHKPVAPYSVRLTVISDGKRSIWSEIPDLAGAGPEVVAPDPAHAPGTLWETQTKSEVFVLDAEAGTLRFGDGLRGKRPPADAVMVVDYDYSVGAEGNLRADMINQAPDLPPALTISNPLPSWGGSDAETPEEGQKHVARFLQHRDRLVTDEDFRVIPLRAPGLDIGRVEVLPLYDPRLRAAEPGAAPGVVTLLVVPKTDALHPDTPEPTPHFLQALCSYLEPRRLLTTELVLRGPIYTDIWVSVGIGVATMQSTAVVRRSVERALRAFLSPLPATDRGVAELSPLLTAPDPEAGFDHGWPWRKAVTRGELVASVARVSGVVSVLGLQLAAGTGADTPEVGMGPLNFPRLAGLSVVVGAPLDLAQMRGSDAGTGSGGGGQGGTRTPPTIVPVPVIPREC